jgi:NAD(P)-dependent dehydrogenase (short-subunit alcohol dehydrogenase family)
MSRLTGKNAVVTGGASGIGEGIVRVLVAEGARVVVADIDDERGAALVRACGGAASYEHTDVTREGDVARVVARAREELGTLDILCNNAGALIPRGSILEISSEAFDFAIALLLRSVFYGLKHGGAAMVAQGEGVIVNTASTAGLVPGGGPHVYAAAKAAVIHLTKSASLELGEKGVRVNCVCPGGVVTSLTLDAVGAPASAAAQLHEAMGTMRPLGRATTPEDVGNAVAFLAGDEARNITGQAITVDAGETTGLLWSKQAVR